MAIAPAACLMIKTLARPILVSCVNFTPDYPTADDLPFRNGSGQTDPRSIIRPFSPVSPIKHSLFACLTNQDSTQRGRGRRANGERGDVPRFPMTDPRSVARHGVQRPLADEKRCRNGNLTMLGDGDGAKSLFQIEGGLLMPTLAIRHYERGKESD